MLAGFDLNRRFRDGTGLRAVSVSISPREVKIIMGPSGAGKTTLLRVLALLDHPDSGTLELDGHRYAFPRGNSAPVGWPYPCVTLVFQQLFLWPHLTNRRNLELPARTEDQKSRLKQIVELLEITPFLNKHPNESSLGQRQRIAIARAVALKPSYLLLDEATSALDWSLAQRVADLLRSESAAGLGALVVTHDPRFAHAVGGKVLQMEHGLLSSVEDGNDAV